MLWFVRCGSIKYLCRLNCVFVFLRLAGLVGAASWHPFAHRWPLHVHIGSAFRSIAFAAHGRMDVAHPLRTEEGLGHIRMPDLDDAADWASGGARCCWWVIFDPLVSGIEAITTFVGKTNDSSNIQNWNMNVNPQTQTTYTVLCYALCRLYIVPSSSPHTHAQVPCLVNQLCAPASWLRSLGSFVKAFRQASAFMLANKHDPAAFFLCVCACIVHATLCANVQHVLLYK